MKKSKTSKNLLNLFIVLLILGLPGFSLGSENASNSTSSWPGLRWLDACMLAEILKQQPGLLEAQEDGSKKIFWAKTIKILRREIPGQDFPGKDGPWYLFYGPFDPSRWDLEINGRIIDPRKFFIQWDNQIMNLGLLMTYASEFPEDSTAQDEYRSDWNAGP